MIQVSLEKAYSGKAETVFSYHDSGLARTPIDSLFCGPREATRTPALHLRFVLVQV